jgi:hypothetical protein
MTLWALRCVVLGNGAWLTIGNEEHLARLDNPPRRRTIAAIPSWLSRKSLF